MKCKLCNKDKDELIVAEEFCLSCAMNACDEKLERNDDEIFNILESIVEYWNGSPDSAVDAIETAMERAKEGMKILTPPTDERGQG